MGAAPRFPMALSVCGEGKADAGRLEGSSTGSC